MERAAFSSCAQVVPREPASAPLLETRPLLALVTSGSWTSVALLSPGARGLECESLAEPAGADQSKRLLAMIGELLGPRSLATAGAIAFDEGPGAFTGLRIGCAVAQGLGFVANLPLVAVGSLEAAAWRRLRQAGGDAAVVLAVNDARMGESYVSLCAVRAPERPGEGPSVRTLVAPRVEGLRVPPNDMSRAIIEEQYPDLSGQRWLAAGDAWHRVALGEGWFLLADVGSQAGAPADARAVAELGWTLWHAGRGIDAGQAAPRYVRNKVALDVGEQQRLREGRLAMLANRGPS